MKITGTLIYDPIRRDFRKQYKERTLLVQFARDDLDLYYQWFLAKQFGSGFCHISQSQNLDGNTHYLTCPKISRPMFGVHCTIVAGTEPGFKSRNWGKYHRQKITVEASENLQLHWKFWYLPVLNYEHLNDIRLELGLKCRNNFHITIAREH